MRIPGRERTHRTSTAIATTTRMATFADDLVHLRLHVQRRHGLARTYRTSSSSDVQFWFEAAEPTARVATGRRTAAAARRGAQVCCRSAAEGEAAHQLG